MHYHLEDFDDRGQRQNLRLQGLPDSVEPLQLNPTVTAIFSPVLARLKESPVLFERIHTALRQKGKDTDLTRDVICCLVEYKLKQNILQAARVDRPATCQEEETSIY